MSAIDNKHLIEIAAINPQKGISRKTGLPYEIHKAQCLVRGPDNSVNIGELNLSKDLAEKTLPGRYLAEFELAVDFNRLVVPRIVALHAWAGPAADQVAADRAKAEAELVAAKAKAAAEAKAAAGKAAQPA